MQVHEQQQRYRARFARRCVALMLCLLLLFSGSLQPAYGTLVLAGTGEVQVISSTNHPDALPHEGHLGIEHCQVGSSCACCAPIAVSPLFLNSQPDQWPLCSAALAFVEFINRHCHPPRLPAHT